MTFYIYAYFDDAPNYPYYWNGGDNHWHVEGEQATIYNTREEADAILKAVQGTEIMQAGIGTINLESVEKKIDKLLEQVQRATVTDDRAAWAWYILYPLDAYALGPYRFREPVTADVAVAQAEEQFGELPSNVWPDGRTVEVDEYSYEVGDYEENFA
jgi:hypothetical protein